MKKCRRCFESKLLIDFYEHPQMKDGYLNICKKCKRKEAIKRRNKNIDIVREKDRKRNMLPHRIEARKEYISKNLETVNDIKRKYIKNNPEKRKAHNILNNAIRNGEIIKPNRCGRCNKINHIICGHHKDYSKPLEVEWLCPLCHRGTF